MISYGTKKYTIHFGGYVAGKFLNPKNAGKIKTLRFLAQEF